MGVKQEYLHALKLFKRSMMNYARQGYEIDTSFYESAIRTNPRRSSFEQLRQARRDFDKTIRRQKNDLPTIGKILFDRFNKEAITAANHTVGVYSKKGTPNKWDMAKREAGQDAHLWFESSIPFEGEPEDYSFATVAKNWRTDLAQFEDQLNTWLNDFDSDGAGNMVPSIAGLAAWNQFKQWTLERRPELDYMKQQAMDEDSETEGDVFSGGSDYDY